MVPCTHTRRSTFIAYRVAVLYGIISIGKPSHWVIRSLQCVCKKGRRGSRTWRAWAEVLVASSENLQVLQSAGRGCHAAPLELTLYCGNLVIDGRWRLVCLYRKQTQGNKCLAAEECRKVLRSVALSDRNSKLV